VINRQSSNFRHMGIEFVERFDSLHPLAFLSSALPFENPMNKGSAGDHWESEGSSKLHPLSQRRASFRGRVIVSHDPSFSREAASLLNAKAALPVRMARDYLTMLWLNLPPAIETLEYSW